MGWNDHAVMWYEVEIEAGKTYSASGFFKKNGNGDWTGFGIDFKDENDVEISETVKTISSTSGYEYFKTTGVAPAGATKAVLWVVSSGSGGSLQMDNVELKEE